MEKSRRDKVKPLNRKMVRRFKLMRGCQHCGYKKFHGALHLHHRDPDSKVSSPSNNKAIQYNWSPTKIKAELAKCKVLCANCHAEEHANDIDVC